MTTAFTFTTTADFSEVSQDVFATFTSAQVAALSKNQLDSLYPEQLGALSVSAIVGLKLNLLGIDNISYLTQKQISALTPAQIGTIGSLQAAGLTPDQMPAFTTAQAASFSSKALVLLNADQIPVLNYDFISALPAKTFAAFTNNQISALTLDQMYNITSAQIGALTSAQIAAFSSEDIFSLNPSAIAGFNKSNMAGLNLSYLLGDGQLAALKPAQFSFLTTKQITEISTDTAALLSSDAIGALTSTQVHALTTAAIETMDPFSITGFTAKNIIGLESNQIAALTTDQIVSLSSSQIKALTSFQIASLEPDDIGVLSPNAFSAITSLAAIQPEQLPALTVDQISALSANQLKQFTPQQVNNFSQDVKDFLGLASSSPVVIMPPVAVQHQHTGTIQIIGETVQDQTLSIQNTLNDEDGLSASTPLFHYQWLQNGKAISGATQSTYTLSENDIGTAISVKVSYTDGLNKLETVTSGATDLVDVKTQPPSYALSVDKTSANEGDTVTFKLATENVADSTEIPFNFGGTISNADVLGGLKTSSFVVDANGKASLAVKFIADKITEGSENLTLTLNSGESQSVSVKDTSVTPVVIVKPIEPVQPPTPTAPKETVLETKNPYFVGKDSNADNVIGSVIGDDISGNIGNDTLKGGDGDDTINGGNDNDQIFGEEGDDKLKGGAGNDSLDGGAGSDKLEGEAGNDTLNGGLGADEMIGGDGDDNYIIDNQNDKITEATNPQGGNDTASISIGLKWQNNFSRFAGVENFILTGDKQDEFDAAGDDNTNILTGNIGNNRLYGNGGNDTLIGNDGNDTLDGGAGIDLLQGGAGDDTYVVNNEEDIIEDNKGVDTIQSSETITLSKYPTVEMLELTGSKSIKGTGNSNNNLIEGNEANNELNGKSGNDTLKGGSGDDTLIGDAGDDSLDGGDGEDTVRYDESKDSYATKSIDGIYTVINKATGETDQLTDVEFVEFSDGTESLGVSTTPLHLSIADISIQEGNKAGATNAKVVLTLDKPATETFTVDLNTQDGTALVGKDYKAVQKTITFNEGDKKASVQIPIISDKVFEADENFSVHLDNLSLDSVELDNTDANVTILNDDKPSLSFAAVKITEGQKGKANAEISVTLSSVISQAVKVHYQTVDGTALKAKDYTATTGDLIIPANTKTAKISIPIIDDKLAESTETFTVKFSAPDYALLPNNASATVSILDNDSPILVTGTPS